MLEKMAGEGNGRAAEPGQKVMNGHAKAPRARPLKKQKSSSILSTITWLLTWYSIITIAFRCPATINLVTDSSPKICKPYFQVRAIVAPHIQPYYDTYASSYVEAARPYYDTLDSKIITPVTYLGKKYGAPRAAQAQSLAQAQWEKRLQPEVQKYQAILKKKYDQTLGPRVDAAITATTPYFDLAKTSALETYYGHILPTYTTVQPYVVQTYEVTSDFAINTAIPYSKWAWTTGAVFLDRTVWPKLKILYGENVEPQLVRIGERLGRYRDGKKLKAVVDNIESSSAANSPSSTASKISASISSTQTTTSSVSNSAEATSTTSNAEAPPAIPNSEREVRENAQVVVAHDLKTWQEKFAKAADEGSDDLEDRITEITDRLIKNQAEMVGKALIVELEETVTSSIHTLKSSVITIVKAVEDREDPEEAIHTAVRKAGVTIKDKAQSVRSWRHDFDAETNSLVGNTAQDTLDILDHIRDLGLQEIGMRWAWTDGITHKDWAKYHLLKTKFDEWRYDVEKVATEHIGLAKARAASEEIESQAMAIAEDAAKELTRLKETSRWKLSAKDSSDDFNTKHMPAAAVSVTKKVVEQISEVVAPSSQGTIESVTSVASASIAAQVENAHNLVSSISENIVGISRGSAESVISEGSATLSSILEQASNSIIGTQQGSIESVVSVAQVSANSVVDQASSSIIGTTKGNIESLTSVISQSISSLSTEVSSSLLGQEPVIPEPKLAEKASGSIKSAVSEVSNSASSLWDVASSSVSSGSGIISSATSEVSSLLQSEALSASKKVWGGAMAQKVEVRQIVYDDIIDDSDDIHFSEKLQSMASEAGDRYSDITKAVSEALLKPTSTSQLPITKLAAEKYSSALSAASAALYGGEQGTGESISGVVASRYTNAVSAASAIIYGTPVPITDSIAAKATNVYNAALSRAKDHYSQARSIVSAQISGEPKPVHEEMFSSVEAAYSDSVKVASSRLNEALSAASTAVYGTPTPAYQSVFLSLLEVAQSNLAEGLGAASSHFDEATNYVAAISTPAPAKQKLLAQIQNQYYAGIGLAHARQSEFLKAVSSAILPKQTPFHESLYKKASANIVGTPTPAYEAALSTASAAIIGTETPWSESVASAASQNWEALITKVSSQVYGAPTPYFITRRLLSEAKEYAAQATDGVAFQYSAVQSLVSELVSGKEPDFTESVYNRLSSAYNTGAAHVASYASSYASEVYVSASSVVSAVFTPPPIIEDILDVASARVNEAVEAASVQFYGTQKGVYEEATSSAASAYSSVQSVASEKIYGSSTEYPEAVQISISNAVSSAQKAISEAIYGTPTGTYESITSAAGESLASATLVIGENISAATSIVEDQYSSIQAKVSSAVYGPEQGAVESAQSRLSEAVESARVRLAEFAASAGEGASEIVRQASEGVEDFASKASNVIESATSRVKDEL